MKPDYRSTSSGRSVTQERGTLAEQIEGELYVQAKVEVAVRLSAGGTIHIKAKDYADWLISKIIVKERYGFANIVREVA